jgi:hydrogenase-4 component E
MERYLDLLSVLMLLSAIMLVSHKRIRSYIRTFRLQAILIAIIAGFMGMQSLVTEGSIDILVICVIIIALKVIIIPMLLHRTFANVEDVVEKDFYLNIPILILMSCVLVVFSYFTLSGISTLQEGHVNLQVVNAFSVILIGFFFMISRKKALGQIIGYLVMENGIFITAIFSTHGMPFIVDIGIFIDMLTAVLIMGVMVVQINDKFDSININNLRNLRG